MIEKAKRVCYTEGRLRGEVRAWHNLDNMEI